MEDRVSMEVRAREEPIERTRLKQRERVFLPGVSRLYFTLKGNPTEASNAVLRAPPVVRDDFRRA